MVGQPQIIVGAEVQDLTTVLQTDDSFLWRDNNTFVLIQSSVPNAIEFTL